MIIGHENISKIRGTWFRYTYFNNRIECFVYCHNDETYFTLLSKWNRDSELFCKKKYFYTDGYTKEEISIEEILIDQNFKLKCFFGIDNHEYIQ
jgi:hypothetical protein